MYAPAQTLSDKTVLCVSNNQICDNYQRKNFHFLRKKNGILLSIDNGIIKRLKFGLFLYEFISNPCLFLFCYKFNMAKDLVSDRPQIEPSI